MHKKSPNCGMRQCAHLCVNNTHVQLPGTSQGSETLYMILDRLRDMFDGGVPEMCAKPIPFKCEQMGSEDFHWHEQSFFNLSHFLYPILIC